MTSREKQFQGGTSHGKIGMLKRRADGFVSSGMLDFREDLYGRPAQRRFGVVDRGGSRFGGSRWMALRQRVQGRNPHTGAPAWPHDLNQ